MGAILALLAFLRVELSEFQSPAGLIFSPKDSANNKDKVKGKAKIQFCELKTKKKKPLKI